MTLTLISSCLAGADSKASVATLAWMSGCWEGTLVNRHLEEYWTSPSGQTLLGLSRTVVQGKTVAYEFMRIHEEEATLVFTAQPSGQKQASFRMARSSDREVVFENPEHDFPQRVIYRRDTAGGLIGRIEGEQGGTARGVDFPMKRSECR
jgi:hypothetical protein